MKGHAVIYFNEGNERKVSYLNLKTNKILDIFKYIDNLKKLIMEFGIEETEEMKNLRKEIIDLMLQKKDYKQKYKEYDDLVRNLVNNKKSTTEKLQNGNNKIILIKKKDKKNPTNKKQLDNDMKLDIALILLTGLIYLQGGKIKNYNENIKQAIQYYFILEDKKYKNQILHL